MNASLRFNHALAHAAQASQSIDALRGTQWYLHHSSETPLNSEQSQKTHTASARIQEQFALSQQFLQVHTPSLAISLEEQYTQAHQGHRQSAKLPQKQSAQDSVKSSQKNLSKQTQSNASIVLNWLEEASAKPLVESFVDQNLFDHSKAAKLVM